MFVKNGNLINIYLFLLSAAGLAQQVSPDSTGSPEGSYGPYPSSLPQRSRSSPAVTPDSTKPLHTTETSQTISGELKTESFDPDDPEKGHSLGVGPNSADPSTIGHHSRSLGDGAIALGASHHGFDDPAGNAMRRLQVTTSEYGDGMVDQARSESIDGGDNFF